MANPATSQNRQGIGFPAFPAGAPDAALPGPGGTSLAVVPEAVGAPPARRADPQVEEIFSPQPLEVALRAQLDRVLAEVVAVAVDAVRPLAERPVHWELLANRLRALYPEPAPSEELITLGELVIDLAGHEVRRPSGHVHLTRREFQVLRLLLQERGRALAREEILERVWRDQEVGSRRTVDIHVHRLRAKLGESFCARLETLRHVGYKLRFDPLPPVASEPPSAD
ncbi:MAG TPA: winged helix-turn-helix domain-containing protein [Polyangiaceae bacterium]|nr:winged helix-turn-helix domain-containing protein [Polyangiaceae bacterium]